MEGEGGNTRPRPAVAEAARTAQRPGLILAASDAVGTLGGATPLPWHAPPRLCGEPIACADRKESSRAYGHERITTPIGRRGKPVKKLRLIPAEDAHAMARNSKGTKGTTVSVI